MLPFFLMLALSAGPEAEMRAVLERQAADWNRGDIVAFMTGYEDAGSTTFQGQALTRGYQQVLDRYRTRYATRAAMGRLTFSEIEVRVLGGEAGLVLGRFALEREAAAGGPASGRFTLVFRKTARGWKIIHDHTS
jgi:uncharacterized protein (TIGR02246 family)